MLKTKNKIIGCIICILAIIIIFFAGMQIVGAKNRNDRDTETYTEDSRSYYYYIEDSDLPGTPLDTPTSQDYIPTEEN